jgi:hypothetical protein
MKIKDVVALLHDLDPQGERFADAPLRRIEVHGFPRVLVAYEHLEDALVGALDGLDRDLVAFGCGQVADERDMVGAEDVLARCSHREIADPDLSDLRGDFGPGGVLKRGRMDGHVPPGCEDDPIEG